ncbi:MAG: tRNA 4-thiouridine(8) synthase ThiI [Lachnospiraceae bacterium]|nr:tRNA 4-thiouridine(8) synthase ThiI [Lachnospiraceae bacterium]
MVYKAFIVKYSEISLKGKNRFIFEDKLCDQISLHLKECGEFLVKKEEGRVFVEALSDYDYDEVIDALQHVFGITAICPAVRLKSREWEDIAKGAVEYMKENYSSFDFTFKVFCKRGDKHYPITSPEICVNLGEVLLDNFPTLKVDVKNPQEKITIEIRNDAYVYSTEIKGAGGMPLGTSGKAMLLLSGGIDSPVAGYMIAKRGVTIEATYFHAPPYTSERAKEKVIDLAKIISKYTGHIKLHVVNFTDVQLHIYETCPHDELTIIMRRYMMMIAEHFANKDQCIGLVTGESIGQVASQTMQSLLTTNAVCTLPVYRPLIAFDKQDIIDISEKIGTFETSILPFEDCCTIFVAKHPVTKPTLQAIEKSEKKLGEKMEELVKTAIDTVEIIEI